MSADHNLPPVNITGCLGVIIGGCDFSGRLREELPGRVGCSKYYSWTPHQPYDNLTRLDPFDLKECIAILLQDGVSHLVHGGGINIPLLSEARPEAEQDEFRRNPRRFFKALAESLAAGGISLISVRELFKDFAAHEGPMGECAVAPEIAAQLPRLKAGAMGLCDYESLRNVAQAVVFDIGGKPAPGADLTLPLYAIETSTTDGLLRDLAPKDEGVTRVLIKVKPKDAIENIDDPIVGPKTVEVAYGKEVDIIAIDAVHGIVVNREETARRATAAGIALLGV